ncbi:MAG TPA: glycosyltransferase family 9 protein [Nitrospira sp.]|nr:glycosyltransferase family 9 protein [Nitrospira sp.]
MRSLIVQLARLGDVIQTLPAIAALNARDSSETLDVLCAASLTGVVSLFPGIRRVLPWDGDRWRQWAGGWRKTSMSILPTVESYLQEYGPALYGAAYNLNQHPRSILAAHLLARKVVGPGHSGPVAQGLPRWAAYLREVARDRRPNSVHLADAFCGMCGVTPPGFAPRVAPPAAALPHDLACIGEENHRWIAVIVGAGDVARCLPPQVWAQWIGGLLNSDQDCRVVLIGTAGERSRALAIQDGLSPLLLGRLWDATGRTDLCQLASLLARCRWATGADTGSLHLAAAVGIKTLGFYFARARVHETGPYGEGHWVWQASSHSPTTWPVAESLSLILESSEAPVSSVTDGWQLWRGHMDEWGASFTRPGQADSSKAERVRVWNECMSDSEKDAAVLR